MLFRVQSTVDASKANLNSILIFLENNNLECVSVHKRVKKNEETFVVKYVFSSVHSYEEHNDEATAKSRINELLTLVGQPAEQIDQLLSDLIFLSVE